LTNERANRKTCPVDISWFAAKSCSRFIGSVSRLKEIRKNSKNFIVTVKKSHVIFAQYYFGKNNEVIKKFEKKRKSP
jgi:hypothetical protein